MATFKTIIKSIEDFCEEHVQINKFGWGPISHISTTNNDFIMVWLLPKSATQEHSSTKLNFDMYIFDLQKQDYSNLEDVLNDTLLVGRDIISNFFDNEDEYGFVMNEIADAEPFDYKFDDFTAGWVFRIEVEYENSLNTCSIPIEPDEPEPVIVKIIEFEFQSQECIIDVEDIVQDDVIIFLISNPFLQIDTLIPIYYTCEDDCVYYQGNPIASGTSVWFRVNQRDGGLIVALQVLRDGELIDFVVRLVRFIEN